MKKKSGSPSGPLNNPATSLEHGISLQKHTWYADLQADELGISPNTIFIGDDARLFIGTYRRYLIIPSIADRQWFEQLRGAEDLKNGRAWRLMPQEISRWSQCARWSLYSNERFSDYDHPRWATCGVFPELKCLVLKKNNEACAMMRQLTHDNCVRTHCTRMCRISYVDILTTVTCSCAMEAQFKYIRSSEPAFLHLTPHYSISRTASSRTLRKLHTRTRSLWPMLRCRQLVRRRRGYREEAPVENEDI